MTLVLKEDLDASGYCCDIWNTLAAENPDLDILQWDKAGSSLGAAQQ